MKPRITALIIAAALALCGCSSGSAKWTPGPIVTVDVTPTASGAAVEPTATPATSASTSTGVAAPTVPDATGAIDVTSFGGGHFASPSGRIWCAVADGWALCHFPKGMKMAKVPKAAQVCPDDGLDVTGISVDATTSFFCSGDPAAFPKVGEDSTKWWKSSGFPSVKYDGTKFAVLPYGEKLQYGNFVCISEKAGVTCANTDSGAGFRVALAGVTLIES